MLGRELDAVYLWKVCGPPAQWWRFCKDRIRIQSQIKSQTSLKIITRLFVLSIHVNMLYFCIFLHLIAGEIFSTIWKSLVSLKCKFLLIEYNNIQFINWILWDPWQKENVCECPLNRDYNESRWKGHNSTSSITLYKFSHCRQLKRFFIVAASYCDLF